MNKEMSIMPLVTSTEMFKKAYDGGYAIGAFNVNNMKEDPEVYINKMGVLFEGNIRQALVKAAARRKPGET